MAASLAFLGLHSGRSITEHSVGQTSSRWAEGKGPLTRCQSLLSPHSRCSANTSLQTNRLFSLPCILFRSMGKETQDPRPPVPALTPHSSGSQLWQREQPLPHSLFTSQVQLCTSLPLLTRGGKGEGTLRSGPTVLPASCFLIGCGIGQVGPSVQGCRPTPGLLQSACSLLPACISSGDQCGKRAANS